MGSTNPAEEEHRRRVAARDRLSNRLPSSQGGVERARRDRWSGHALSGQTTTARGHIIVPPTKARLVAFEYEHVPERDPSENDTPHSDGHCDVDTEERFSRTVTLMMSGSSSGVNRPAQSGGAVSDSPSPKLGRAGVARNEFSNTGNNETYHTNTADVSQRVNNVNKTMSTEADKSAHRVDRNHRSLAAATTIGAVTGTNSEVPSRIVALREEYEVKKQSSDTQNTLTLNETQRGITTSGDASQGKTGRRRRGRQSAQSNEQVAPSSKQSNSTGKLLTSFNALGNANPRRKYSPYPTYIQPVIEENSSYRGPSNRMPYHSSQSSSYAAQRSRKISTEMNRYESSSSSSSSSSEPDLDSPNRPVTKKAVNRAMQARNVTLETPDTSDAEKQKPGLRRRRRVRTRGVPTSSKQVGSNNQNLTSPAANESRGRERVHGGMGRRRHHNVIPLLEDKYVSLPDNYKPSKFYTAANCAGDGDIVQLVEGTNSQGAVRKEPSNVGNRSTSSNTERDTDLERGSPSVKVIESASSAGIPTRSRRKSNFPSPTNADQLIITKEEKVGHRRALSTSTSREISHSVDRIPQQPHTQGHAEFTLSTPNLPRTDSDDLKALQKNNIYPTEDHQYIGRARKNSIGGETKHSGDLGNKFEKNDAPKGDSGRLDLKPFQHSVGEDITSSNLRNEYDDAPEGVQRQPKLTARKVGQSYWPPDESTKRLLSHTTPRSFSTSSASVTMQETIDQLHSFANEETPIKSRSNSITALTDYSRTYESDKPTADIASQQEIPTVGRKSPNNHRSSSVGLSRMQMVKTTPKDASSPCMSSTETLKDCSSSGELQDQNSRSPSIDSTASNPEATGHNGVNDRNTRAKVVYAGRSTPIMEEFLIVEQGQDLAEVSHQSDTDPLGAKLNAKSSEDLSSNLPSKTMAEQFNSLTDALKKFMPSRSLPNTAFEKATLRQDAVLTVSARGSVTCQPPKLETVSEQPDYSEIDEGIVTEVESNKDPKSFLKLDEHLEESNKRRHKRSPPQKDSDSNGNESARSLSDPSADRKRSQPGPSSLDSNLLSALGKNEDMGSLEHASCSSSSHFSENPSSYSDTLNIEEISEERESDETGKNQTKVIKKKSRSDPSPDGFICLDGSEVITEPDESVMQAASSEPSMEQSDKLGDLDHFHNYQSTKVFSSKLGPVKPQCTSERICTLDDINKHPPRKPTMKKKNRQQTGTSSIIDRLLADRASPVRYDNNEEATSFEMHTRPTSTSSPSGESSPIQKQGPGARFLEPETEEQFLNLYASMTSKSSSGSPELKHHPPVVHTRSNSEPVHMINITGQMRAASESYPEPYGNRGRRHGMYQTPPAISIDGIPDTACQRPIFKHSQSEDPVFSPQGFSPIQKNKKPGHDMRLHAFENLRDTEESYVSSLRILYEDYMTPLKHPENHSTCEPRLVDEMFYKIPQLYQHHKKFYEEVKRCYDDWNKKEVRLGELFLNAFNENALLETYTAYITNYLNAREAVRNAGEKEAFRRFVEQCRAENKEKQGLADLMIKPVQRIPRYELLIKDMLKHTPEEHPDREGLLTAQKEIHKLAERMDRSEKEAELAEKQDRLLTDLEQLIEGLMDLCVPKRRFLRQDIVNEVKNQKKDRSIWLFNDLIVCSTRKTRTGSFKKGSMWNLNIGQDKYSSSIDFGYKYKFLWKFPLEDVNIENSSISGRQAVDKQLQSSQNDLDILLNMQKQALQVECNHVQLDESLREIITHVGQQITEKKQISIQPICPSGRVELSISTGDGMKTFLFEFFSDDSKVQFEKLFSNAKRNLTTFKNRWEPTFTKAIPISRTRAGMQFSCAASNVDASPDVKEVWVCNTDGYVGQVCFLTLEPELSQTQCITVCHAKICCIAQVPAWERRLVPTQTLIQEVANGTIVPSAAVNIMSWDDPLSDEENTSSHSTISSQSSSVNQSPYCTLNGGRPQYTKKFSLDSMLDMRRKGDDISLPIMSPLIDSPLLRRRFGFGQLDRQLAASQPAIYYPLADPRENMISSDFVSPPGFGSGQGAAWSKGSDGSTLHGSLEDLLGASETVVGDAQNILAGKDSMWLGTEDGKIHIYPSLQSTRGSKHCVQVRHSAAVHCILYHEGQVFVALSNGDLVVYTRNKTTGEWDFENGMTKAKISSPYAITKMVVVSERKQLWCGCQNLIKIVAIEDLTRVDVAVTDLIVANDNKRQVYCMVNCGYGVWVALDKRPQIKLYHTVTHELLADIDVSAPVSKMLASADAIIRQHKAACLRITALLVCNDLLWVGTSAGVVLTLTLPKIAAHASALAMPVMPQGLAYGHTGHVRFLTCAQLPEKEQHSLSRGGSRRASTSAGKRCPSTSSNAPNPPRMISVIISGGDGYEDFRMNSNSASAGRDDSTNHLLVWRT